MTYDDLMKILEEEIVGDGQGYPDGEERHKAAKRILKELEGENEKSCIEGQSALIDILRAELDKHDSRTSQRP